MWSGLELGALQEQTVHHLELLQHSKLTCNSDITKRETPYLHQRALLQQVDYKPMDGHSMWNRPSGQVEPLTW